MPWERVNAASTIEAMDPIDVANMFSSSKFLVVDCRRILRAGLLPNTAVFRRRGSETLEQAMDRVIEEVMFTNPPEDQRRALLVDYLGAACSEEAADMCGVAAFLRAKVGCEQCLRIRGGAQALMEGHRYLFSLAKGAAAHLPTHLSARLLLGSSATALDAPMLSALGVTHVVSLVRRELKLAHVAPEQHLSVRIDAAHSDATELRPLLATTLPLIMAVIDGSASDARAVLIHSESVSAPAAAAVACAALVADGASATSIDEAISRLAHRRPKATLPPPVIAQLRTVEAWLRQGAKGALPVAPPSALPVAPPSGEPLPPPPPPPLPSPHSVGDNVAINSQRDATPVAETEALHSEVPHTVAALSETAVEVAAVDKDEDEDEDDGEYAG